MKEVLLAVLATVRAGLRSRAGLQLEILALRHQLAVAAAEAIPAPDVRFDFVLASLMLHYIFHATKAAAR